MHKRNTHDSGFTIVELLIVIVVIAILASISVVTYSQVTKRAHDAKVRTTFAQVTEAVELYLLRDSPYRIPPMYHDRAFFGPGGNGSFQGAWENLVLTHDAPGVGRLLIDREYLPSNIDTILREGHGQELNPSDATSGGIYMHQCGSGKVFLSTRVFYGGISSAERLAKLGSGEEKCSHKQDTQWCDETGQPSCFGGGGGTIDDP